MAKKKATGQTRMKELGRAKIELWLSASHMEALENLTRLFGVRKATLAKRMVNFVVAGGANYAKSANQDRYD